MKQSPSPPLTSIVILAHNGLHLTRLCLASIQHWTNVPYELILIDNASSDGTLDYFRSIAGAQVIANEENLSFAAACNRGIAIARGDFVLLLNNDTLVTPQWLETLVRCAMNFQDVGLFGPRSNYVSGPQIVPQVPYGQDMKAMTEFAQLWRRSQGPSTTNFLTLSGFCLLIRRAVIEAIGGLDERFRVGCFEDTDYCVRAYLAGFKSLIVNPVFVHHWGSQTFAQKSQESQGNALESAIQENWMTFKEKWQIPRDRSTREAYHLEDFTGKEWTREQLYFPLTEHHL